MFLYVNFDIVNVFHATTEGGGGDSKAFIKYLLSDEKMNNMF